MELTIYEAIKAIQDAIKHGYTPELVINGQYYEIKQNNSNEIINENGGNEND